MELEFKYDMGSLHSFSLADILSKDSFIIRNTSITYKICLGDEEGKGYIAFKNLL